MSRSYRLTPFLIAILGGIASNAHAETQLVNLTVNPEDCEELIDMAENTAQAVRSAGLEAAEQVSAGGTLEEESCVGDLKDYNFDFWSGFSSVKGAAIKALSDEAMNQIRNMACDAAAEVEDAAKQYLTCSASLGITLNIGASFGDINAEECMGFGQMDFDYDAGTYGEGGSDYVIPVDDTLDTEVDVSRPAQSSWDGWAE